jgi:peptide/nickel transport system permease protein
MHINYWRIIRNDLFGRIGLVIILFIILLSVVSPLIINYDPAGYSGLILHPPSFNHLLGTNDVGQDIFSRLIAGARLSLLTGLGTAVFTVIISTAAGCAAAFAPRFIKNVLMRIIDAMLIIPSLILIVLIGAYFVPDNFSLILILSLLFWPGGARVIRSQVLIIRERVHVMTSYTFGAGTFYILKRHVIPELGPVFIALMIQNARRAIFMEAGLSFLGIGNPAVITWGRIIYHAFRFSYVDAWIWWLVPAGAAVTITLAGLSFIGFSLETALDPRLRKAEHH